jgi:hypothetical protein
MIAIAFIAFMALVLAWLLAPVETTPTESTAQVILPRSLGETSGVSGSVMPGLETLG